MGQAKLRGNFDQRTAQSVEKAKTMPPKQKKLNKTEEMMLAAKISVDLLHHLFSKDSRGQE